MGRGLSHNLVWLWRIVPHDAVVEHVVALVVVLATVIEDQRQQGTPLAHIGNPEPDCIQN